MSKDVAFLTGGSGFVGSAVARKLLEAGMEVRALVRAGNRALNLQGLDVKIIEGDMRDPTTVQDAVSNARFAFHVAADYRLWAPKADDIMRANVDGATVVMRSALRAGVERIVYTSSVATLKLHGDATPADESRGLSEFEAIGVYKRSKVAAERLVEKLIGDEGLPAVIVNPSTPIGPRDIKPTPTGRIIVEAASGRMPAFVDTGLNLVHVDDVAAGHLEALRKGRVGERYILGGENISLADMLARIARIVGRRPPRLRLPRQLIYPLAFGAEAVAHFTKREPFVTIDGLKMAANKMYFTSGKAERELGYRQRPIDEAIEEAITWFRNMGYLR